MIQRLDPVMLDSIERPLKARIADLQSQIRNGGAEALEAAADDADGTLTGWGRAKPDVVRWLRARAESLRSDDA